MVAGIASYRRVRAYMFLGLVHASSAYCSSVAIMNHCDSFGGERLAQTGAVTLLAPRLGAGSWKGVSVQGTHPWQAVVL